MKNFTLIFVQLIFACFAFIFVSGCSPKNPVLQMDSSYTPKGENVYDKPCVRAHLNVNELLVLAGINKSNPARDRALLTRVREDAMTPRDVEELFTDWYLTGKELISTPEKAMELGLVIKKALLASGDHQKHTPAFLVTDRAPTPFLAYCLALALKIKEPDMSVRLDEYCRVVTDEQWGAVASVIVLNLKQFYR